MKKQAIIFPIVVALAIATAVTLVVFDIATASSARSSDRDLVEVRVERVWTSEDYNKNWTMSTRFPHTIVTRLDNGERRLILGETWGRVGDTFKVQNRSLITP